MQWKENEARSGAKAHISVVALEKTVVDGSISHPGLILLCFEIMAIGKGDFTRLLINHWQKKERVKKHFQEFFDAVRSCSSHALSSFQKVRVRFSFMTFGIWLQGTENSKKTILRNCTQIFCTFRSSMNSWILRILPTSNFFSFFWN